MVCVHYELNRFYRYMTAEIMMDVVFFFPKGLTMSWLIMDSALVGLYYYIALPLSCISRDINDMKPRTNVLASTVLFQTHKYK